VLKPGGLFFICNEMNVPAEGPAPYQNWKKMMDLNTYSASQFKEFLDQAGFTDIAFEAKGNTRLCVSGKKGAPYDKQEH